MSETTKKVIYTIILSVMSFTIGAAFGLILGLCAYILSGALSSQPVSIDVPVLKSIIAICAVGNLLHGLITDKGPNT